MPRRNIGGGWHLASPSEIAAWQLEVNKSRSCEKVTPLPAGPLHTTSPLPKTPPPCPHTHTHPPHTSSSNSTPNNTTCCSRRFYQPSASVEWIDIEEEIGLPYFTPLSESELDKCVTSSLPPHFTPTSSTPPAPPLTPLCVIYIFPCS